MKRFLILAAAVVFAAAACTKGGDNGGGNTGGGGGGGEIVPPTPPEDGSIVLSGATATFHDDYYNTGSNLWALNMFATDGEARRSEITLYINTLRNFGFEGGVLPPGTFTGADNGAAGTFYRAVVASPSPREGMCYVMLDGVRTPFLVTGGSMKIERWSGTGTSRNASGSAAGASHSAAPVASGSAAGASRSAAAASRNAAEVPAWKGYLITAEVEAYNPTLKLTENFKFWFYGDPAMENRAAKNRTWDAAIETAQAYYYGRTGGSGSVSDRWVVQMAWMDGEVSRNYFVEIHTAQSDGSELPTGTFPMASQAGMGAAGTMEPGTTEADETRRGTWFTSFLGNAEMVNPSAAIPSVGSITITPAGVGAYTIESHFEDSRNNKFLGTYTSGAVSVVDRSPQDFVVDSWNDNGVVVFNGPIGSSANHFTVNLMNGTLAWGADGTLSGAGKWIRLELYTDPAAASADRYIPLGTYTVSAAYAPGTVSAASKFFMDDVDAGSYNEWGVVSGTAAVTARTGDSYTIALDFALSDGFTVRGTFSGDLAFSAAE